MRVTLTIALSGLLAATPAAYAASLDINVEIPRLNVAEYHRPYVAVWIEKPDQTAVKTLAVWYDTKLAKREGETWLKDMRQWWRRAGREMKMPVDGVTGALRAGSRAVGFVGGTHLDNRRAEHAALLRATGAAPVLDSMNGMFAALTTSA